MADVSKRLIRADEFPEGYYSSHPLNSASEVHARWLSRMTGLGRIGVTHVRVPAGKESFVYHSHQHEEEFLYILAGRGIAEIDDAEYEVGPGDFMGFPTPSVGHHLRNPFDEDLVYPWAVNTETPKSPTFLANANGFFGVVIPSPSWTMTT
jgi:uncharacterized cupin superfamily protein